MKKHANFAAFAAVVAGMVAIAVIAAAGGGGRSGAPADLDLPGDEVSLSIDRALGRAVEAQVASKDAFGGEGPSAGSAPASDSVAPRPATGAGSGGAPATEPSASTSVASRKIVQTASLRLQVKDVGDSFGEIGRIATAANGFVAGSNFALQGEQQVASVTVRVPATKYQDVLTEIRALGHKVEAETSNASDVTEEYTDLSARIRNLEASERQLLELLGQAKNVNEILLVQDRLNSTRAQIEQAKGRLALLDKLSDLATITVALRPVATAASGSGVNIGAEVREAGEDSLEFLASVTAAGLSVLVFSWWVL